MGDPLNDEVVCGECGAGYPVLGGHGCLQTSVVPRPAPKERVLVGNEAGRYLAKRLREMVSEFGDNTKFTGLLLKVCDDLDAKGAGSDEQLAYDLGFAAGRDSLAARVQELEAALAVLGIEPPEHDGEEWIVSTEQEPVPAGDTAVKAAHFVNNINTATEIRLTDAVMLVRDLAGWYESEVWDIEKGVHVSEDARVRVESAERRLVALTRGAQ